MHYGKKAPTDQGHQAGGGEYQLFPPTGALGRWELGARSGAGYPMMGTAPLEDHFTTCQIGYVNRQNDLRATSISGVAVTTLR